jgi:hypothetical protein
MTHDALARSVEQRASEAGETVVPTYLNALQTAKRFRRLARRSIDRQLARALAEIAGDYGGEAARLRRRERKAQRRKCRSDR